MLNVKSSSSDIEGQHFIFFRVTPLLSLGFKIIIVQILSNANFIVSTNLD